MKNKEEEILQVKIVNWFKHSYPEYSKLVKGNIGGGLFFGKTKVVGNKIVYNKNFSLINRLNKSGDTVLDFPDLTFFVPKSGYHALFIELKTEDNSPILKNGNLSNSKKFEGQISYGKLLMSLGYYWSFGVGFDHTKKIIDRYMKSNVLKPGLYYDIEN